MNLWDYFVANVDISAGPDGCWPWTGTIRSDGYGQFRSGGENIKPHRWIVEHVIGFKLESDEMVLHDCGNRPCCNPRHLRVGDHDENMQDMWDHGRHFYANRTHCKHGHECTKENTNITPRGSRQCRACNRERQRKHREKVADND